VELSIDQLLKRYDTLCRREELISLRVEDMAEAGDGSESILIRRSKTDATGEGATAYLSPLTIRLLRRWIQEAGIREGPLFVRVLGPSNVGNSITPQVVATILQKVGKWIGLGIKEWQKISGHSARVGAAQEEAVTRFDSKLCRCLPLNVA
jgi:integrase